jgi:hypothetical protein
MRHTYLPRDSYWKQMYLITLTCGRLPSFLTNIKIEVTGLRLRMFLWPNVLRNIISSISIDICKEPSSLDV